MKQSILNFFLVLQATFLAFPAMARQENGARPMSLQDCIDFALRNSDTLKNVRLNVLRQDAQNDQIRALALPRINGNVQFNYFTNPQKTLLPAAFFGDSASDGYRPIQF